MNNRSPYATANSIRMKQIRHKGTFLVVEGDADARFYKMFVNLEQCRVVPANSKGAVIKVLETIADEHSGVLGIVDADYWNVDHISSELPALFSTDTHDLETLILQSSALDKVLAEHGNENAIEQFEKKQEKRFGRS